VARVLVVVALGMEFDAVVGALPGAEPGTLGPYAAARARTGETEVQVVRGGIGPASAASATAAALALLGPVDLAVSAGLAGAYPGRGLVVGDLVAASEIVAGGTGDWAAPGFMGPGEPEWLPGRFEVAPWVPEAAERAGARTGPVLTVPVLTEGTGAAEALARTHREAVAEAMEGAGVALAAWRFTVPVAEIRAVCNLVGAADASRWATDEALGALAAGLRQVLTRGPFAP
jgi:futalosine hydrolase